MSATKLANEQVMVDYLNDLLAEPTVNMPSEEVRQTEPKVMLPEVLVASEQPQQQATDQGAVTSKIRQTVAEVILDRQLEKAPERPLNTLDKTTEEAQSEPFQALFFEVAGLTIAVPLTQLGGIHNLTERNNIPGKPEWFDGVMVHRDQRFNVVDTAQWVMPEKYTQALQAGLSYQYLILLEDSGWGLMCERLVNTQSLSADDVKWSNTNNKRRWLAGLVKEQKCALINVDEMIELMDKGLNCQG